MTGEEMERAIEFLLQNQATLETRVEQTQTQISQVVASIAELNRVVTMQATSQAEVNQALAGHIAGLAEAQAKTERKVDKLADIVEKLVERLSP